MTDVPPTRLAVRLHGPGDPPRLVVEDVPTPVPGDGEVLMRVHAAALTRDELDWPVDRLPAIPSYEASGIVVALGRDVDTPSIGEAVFALTPFDRDGAATEYMVLPASLLAPKPATLSHVESAAIPMTGLTAWQGLFTVGGLQPDERVLIHGAAGGVGHVATQLAARHGAHVIATARGPAVEAARQLGADEVVDVSAGRFEDAVEPVDLVFDTAGGDLLARSSAVLRPKGRIVSIAEEMPDGVEGTYFIVSHDGEQLLELSRLADAGAISVAIDSVFPLAEAAAGFQRVAARGKGGKVVLEVTP